MKKNNILKMSFLVVGILIVSFLVARKQIVSNINKLSGSINKDNLIIKRSKYARFELKNTARTAINKAGTNAKVRNKDLNTKLSSGDIIESKEAGDNTNYTIYVLSDVVGDGKLLENDVDKAYEFVKGKTELNDVEFLSADYTEDDKVDIHDVAKIYNELLKGDDIHKVYIQIDMNGGTLTTDKEKSRYSIYGNDGNLITYNNSKYVHTIPWNNKLDSNGLINWNNSNAVYIYKDGYIAKPNAEYINPSNGKTYNQTDSYNASDFCDASANDCVVTLKVNWINNLVVNFDANGGSVSTNQKTVKTGSTYGSLPTPTRSGYQFMGWFDNSTSKKNSKVYYKNSPLHYYADSYSDLYNVYGYNTTKLYGHYIEYGSKEKRRTSQYNSSDKVNITKSITLYAGWMPISAVATFNGNGGEVKALNSSFTYSGKVSGEGWPRIIYKNNQSYGNFPAVARTGYQFMGWYDCNATAKNDNKIYYKDHPLYYYSDIYGDLYKTFGYNEQKLMNHWYSYGKSENRRTSQIISSDKVSVSSNKVMNYCAGWIKTPTKDRNAVCGVASTSSSCTKYKTCQIADCGVTTTKQTVKGEPKIIHTNSTHCYAQGGQISDPQTTCKQTGNYYKYLEYSDLWYQAGVAEKTCKDKTPSGYKYKSKTSIHDSNAKKYIVTCFYIKETCTTTYTCTIPNNSTKTVTTYKTCQHKNCGCASSSTSTTYNECYHW